MQSSAIGAEAPPVRGEADSEVRMFAASKIARIGWILINLDLQSSGGEFRSVSPSRQEILCFPSDRTLG
jgi:hypothetical protein